MPVTLQRFRPFMAQYVKDLIVTTVVTGTIAILAIALDRFPWSVVLLMVLTTFALVLFILNQLRDYEERFPLLPSDRQLIKEIADTFLKSGFTVREIPNPERNFHLLGVDTSGLGVNIIRRGDLLEIGFAFTLGGDSRRRWDDLPADKRERLLDAIALHLNSLQVTYVGLVDPPIDFHIIEPVPLEKGFNMRIFRGYLRRVAHSAYAFNIMLRRGIITAEEQIKEQALKG